jgi:hypothetical protein
MTIDLGVDDGLWAVLLIWLCSIVIIDNYCRSVRCGWIRLKFERKKEDCIL